MSNHLKFRQSTLDPTKLINNRGDFVKPYTTNHINVNGTQHYTKQSAENAINRLGKKNG